MRVSAKVPYEWSRLVCACRTPKYGLKVIHTCEACESKRSYKISVCQDCQKMHRADLHKCQDCKNWFYRQEFRSNKKCLRNPRCLTCISRVQTPCTEHENCFWAYSEEPELDILHTFELHTLDASSIDSTLDALLDSEPVNFFD